MRLDLIGDVYTPVQLAIIKKTMTNYGLEDYQLVIVQDLQTSLFNLFEKTNSQGLLENAITIR